jgi:O-antigen ligase
LSEARNPALAHLAKLIFWGVDHAGMMGRSPTLLSSGSAARRATTPGGGSRLAVGRAASAQLPAANDGLVLVLGLLIGAGLLVGMAFGVGAITLTAFAVAVVAAIVNPAVGLVTLAFMAPLKSPLGLPQPGLDALLVVAVLAGCLYRLPIERPKLSLGAPLLFLLAFVLYAFVQQLPQMVSGYSGDEGHLVSSLFLQLLICVGTVMAAGIVLLGRRPYPFLAALLVSASLAASLAILANGPSVGPQLANLLGQASDVRAIGPFGNPNSFGQFLASALTLTAACLVSSRSHLVRLGLVTTGVVLLAGLALSLSRGGMVALFAGLVALVYARTRSRRLGIAAVAVGLALLLVVYPAFVEWRLVSQTGSALEAAKVSLAQSDEGRLSGAVAGLALFGSAPIFGVGFGQYSLFTVSLAGTTAPIAAHNWYMNVLGEEGLVGILIWLLLMIAVAARLPSRSQIPRTIGYAVGINFAVGSMFLEPPTSFQTSALTLIVLTAALVANWTDDLKNPIIAATKREAARPGAIGKEAG